MARFARWAAALAAVFALGLSALWPASGAPSPEPLVDRSSSTQVTLITGDEVEMIEAAPGRYSMSVEPAEGRESITFHVFETDDGMQVVPSDAVPYLASGVVDEALFDVHMLAEHGYDNASMEQLPLIATYSSATSQGVDALASIHEARTFTSIHGAAFAVEKDDLPSLWTELVEPVTDADAEPALAAGVEKIWLDARVNPALDRSTAQIGAPDAWGAGFSGKGVNVAVLDTGVDFRHPDLAGRIQSAENFTDSLAATDIVGHGTHVAATIAGTGAASDGARAGVAPGADLLIGKVLNDSGMGLVSWIIDGMEWAVAEGADIVNMSLGADPTDGTDPLSQAVDRLSEEGALFVVSAGNAGHDYSVGSPGAATSALTVGAVDRDDQLASFSSRGPRVGDNGLKPEITAPGVGIVAARGVGTSLGTPVDRDYSALSGTSMAAPHVAGVAALLAQQHPEWDGSQLKDALVSTAHPHPELGVFEQGAGRVDARRAVMDRVYATGVVDIGLNRPDESDSTATEQITYVNHTDAPVTLALDIEVTNVDTAQPVDEGIKVGADTVTVPAGATASVDVWFDLSALEIGRYTGRIIATSDDHFLTTVVAGTIAGPLHTVTLRAMDRSGEPAFAPIIVLRGAEPRLDHRWWGTTVTLEVEEGTYALTSLIEEGQVTYDTASFITIPDLQVTGDMEVALDAREAVPVRIETPRPTEQQAEFSYSVYRKMGNGRSFSHNVRHFSATKHLFVTPTDSVEAGEFEFSSRWHLVEPRVTTRVTGVAGPLEIFLLPYSPAFDRSQRLSLIYAGAGTPEDLAAVDVEGAAVIVEGSHDHLEGDQVNAAAEAGAATVFIVRPADSHVWSPWHPFAHTEPIPAMVVEYADGRRMIDAARARSTRIELTHTVASPYLYDVMHVERDRVPEDVVHKVARSNTAQLDVAYAYTGGLDWAKEQRFGWRPWQAFSLDVQRYYRAGLTRQEWVSAGDTLWQHRVHYVHQSDELNPLLGGVVDEPRTYSPGRANPVSWYEPVMRPAAPKGSTALTSTRVADVLRFRIPEFVDASSHHYGFADYGSDEITARVLRDGGEIARRSSAFTDIETTSEQATYRLELSTSRPSSEWAFATETETAWEFTSGRPAGDEPVPLPLLQVDYDIPTNLRGEVRADGPHKIGLSVRHQDGVPALKDVVLHLDISYDDGDTWQPARIRESRGDFRATAPSGDGFVSVRVRAEDAEGNSVEQTVIRAYRTR